MVIVSGAISEDTAVEALSAGAHDYVLKDNLTRLGPAVDRALRDAGNCIRQELAEKELRKTEAKYRQLHQSMRDGFVHVDMAGRILETNAAFQEMVGYREEELSARDYRTLIPEKWHAREAEALSSQVLGRGYSDVYDEEYRRKDGTVLPVEVRRVLLTESDGTPASIWSTVRDITERKRLENRIQQEKEFLLSVVDKLPDLIYFKDPEGKFLTANAAFLRMLGAGTPTEIVGKTDFDFFPPEVAEQLAVNEKKVIQYRKALVNHEPKPDTQKHDAMAAHHDCPLVRCAWHADEDRRGEPGRDGAQAPRSPAPAGPENGSRRTARRRCGP